MQIIIIKYKITIKYYNHINNHFSNISYNKFLLNNLPIYNRKKLYIIFLLSYLFLNPSIQFYNSSKFL